MGVKEHSTYTDYESALDATRHSIPHAQHLRAISRALTITITLNPIPEINALSERDEPIAIGTKHPYRRDVYFDATTAYVYWIIEEIDGAVVSTTTGLEAYQWPDLQPYLLVMLYCVDPKLKKLKADVHFPGIIDRYTPDVFNELADCYLSELGQMRSDDGGEHLKQMNTLLCRAIDERRRQVTLMAMLRSRWLHDESKGIGRKQIDLARLLESHKSVVNAPLVEYERHWRHFQDILHSS